MTFAHHSRKKVNRYERPKSCLMFLICGSEYTCCSFFRFFCMYHFSFPVVSQQLVSWMNLNLRSPKLASRESYGEENLTQFIQKISSKWICGASWFRHRSCVLNMFKLLELEFASSWMVWRRTFETLKSRIWFKELQIEFERCKRTAFLGMLEAKVTSMWKSAKG